MAFRLALQNPPKEWDQHWANKVKAELESSDINNQKTDEDVIIVANRLILRAPNGNFWAVTINDAGALSATNLGASI